MTHLISRVSAVVAALALAAVAALAGLWGLDAPRSEAAHVPGMTAMSVDANIAGNDADTLGLNNACVSVGAGGSVIVDVTALEIPSSQAMIAWNFRLMFDPSALSVTDADGMFLIDVIQGSAPLTIFDLMPDMDGEFKAAAADTGGPGTSEFGSGVLARVTVAVDAGAAPGEYDLTLANAAHIDGTNHTYLPTTVNNAKIAVDQPCPIGIGDVDCNGAVNSIDALKILRHNASLQVSQTEPCTDLGQSTGSRDQGDVDCNNAVNAIDALKVLRGVAGLTVQQEPGCPSVV
jgi:hypothetical protein